MYCSFVTTKRPGPFCAAARVTVTQWNGDLETMEDAGVIGIISRRHAQSTHVKVWTCVAI